MLEQQITVPGVVAARQLYKYDQANRLTWFTEGAANAAAETCATAAAPLCERFGYDQWGNRLIVDSAGLGPALSQPDAFSSATNRITTAGFTYDDGAPGPGNLTATPAGTFKYDAENRMVSSTTLLGLTQYVYDAEGRRVKKVAGADVTVYVYDGMGQLAAEYGGTVPATARAYLTADHLGSTRVVTNHDGTEVLRRSDYLPFGAEVPVPGGSWRSGVSGYATQTASTNILFTGQLRDSETGLDYFGARYFSSAQGRFTTPDEFTGGPVDPSTGQQIQQPGPLPYADITNPQSLNKYAYVLNNPLRYTDSDGHDIRVTLYKGSATNPFGHIGIGVNSVGTHGLYPKQHSWRVPAGIDVPGVVRSDTLEVDRTMVISTSKDEDANAEKYINGAEGSKQIYNLYDRSCADFVREALGAAGIKIEDVRRPEAEMKNIEKIAQERAEQQRRAEEAARRKAEEERRKRQRDEDNN